MMIPRTVIIDDDGTGLTGTIIDAALMNKIEDRIDAAYLAGLKAQDLFALAEKSKQDSIPVAVAAVGLALMEHPRKLSRRRFFGLRDRT